MCSFIINMINLILIKCQEYVMYEFLQHYCKNLHFAFLQRGTDNLSMRSSDSDVSDVSAMSSASRLSSTSYMSVQSERARASRKIRYSDSKSH